MLNSFPKEKILYQLKNHRTINVSDISQSNNVKKVITYMTFRWYNNPQYSLLSFIFYSKDSRAINLYGHGGSIWNHDKVKYHNGSGHFSRGSLS